ncbi:hypothetical protein [Allohahella marinimesophila]|uniref:Uncharacterized protein n=1 Tax=Allohahella marinimesophila TaxID=1054972 RepID=A0ABP7PYU3_9GAMM
MKWLQESAVILAMVVAFLFSASTAYYDGFLSVFDLDAAVLERSFHLVIYRGWVIAFMPLIIVLACVIAAGLGFAFIIRPTSAWLAERYGATITTWLRARSGLRKYAGSLEETDFTWLEHVLLAVLLLLALLMALVYFEGQGKARAEELRVELLSDPTNGLRITVEGQILQLITCGSRMCAGLARSTSAPAQPHIVYFDVANRFDQTLRSAPASTTMNDS